MDTSRFPDTRSEIAILDFHATMAWRNLTAISFLLGRFGNALTLPDQEEPILVGDRVIFDCFGWIDVIHPCLDHIKARIRANLGPEILDHSMRLKLIETVFDALNIPQDETYEVDFFAVSGHTAIHQTVDRHGMTDRI
jgi:hypothetical protein